MFSPQIRALGVGFAFAIAIAIAIAIAKAMFGGTAEYAALCSESVGRAPAFHTGL